MIEKLPQAYEDSNLCSALNAAFQWGQAKQSPIFANVEWTEDHPSRVWHSKGDCLEEPDTGPTKRKG